MIAVSADAKVMFMVPWMGDSNRARSDPGHNDSLCTFKIILSWDESWDDMHKGK
jgi:hypothetical protein